MADTQAQQQPTEVNQETEEVKQEKAPKEVLGRTLRLKIIP
jgi:hypothetical protein